MPENGEYREPTLAERSSTDPSKPYQHGRGVTVCCPNGVAQDGKITFHDGEEVTNLLRAVISMEPRDGDGNPKDCSVYMMRFNNEIGKIVYEVASCFVGEAQQ